MKFEPCIVIPIYNHGARIVQTIERLNAYGVPMLVIDDGSNGETQNVLLGLQRQYALIQLFRLPVNQGKGAAVMLGFRRAQAAGYTHALQIDADGQHATADVPKFLALAQSDPHAVICGRPMYDQSVPKGRLYGRYVTHFWVWVETLSCAIGDSMCGFRMYPLQATCRLIDQVNIPLRMDFDIEIIVRLAWMGLPIHNVSTPVIYPPDGLSHFKMWQDNWRITKMHTRLFFGMLLRLPRLLYRKWGGEHSTHWAQLAERGGAWGLRFLMVAQRVLGYRMTALILHPIVAYFYCTSPKARQASQGFLKRVSARVGSLSPSRLNTYRQMYAFAQSGLDKLLAWQGRVDASSVDFRGQDEFNALIESGRGALLIGSHLGNLEMMRALAARDRRVTINVVVHTEHAARFNAMMESSCKGFSVNLLQVREMGVDTAIVLKEKIEQGEWLVIVGDRTPPFDNGRVVQADFLGEPAPFAQGPIVLGSVLECPVYLFFCVKKNVRYQVDFELFSDRIVLPRAHRTEALHHWVQRYAHRLEAHALNSPLQWFNFFDFWNHS